QSATGAIDLAPGERRPRSQLRDSAGLAPASPFRPGLRAAGHPRRGSADESIKRAARGKRAPRLSPFEYNGARVGSASPACDPSPPTTAPEEAMPDTPDDPLSLDRQRLERLPQTFDVWQLGTRQLSALVRTGEEAVRPWITGVFSRTEDLILAFELTQAPPSA